jgi:CHASE3 domain sensor protein
MSLLAKVFVVIQTVLIMVFLGVSATNYQHTNDWRGSYRKLKERYKVSTQLASREIDALRQANKSKSDFISSKQTEVSDLKKELDRQNSELTRIRTDLNTEKARFNTEQSNLTTISNQKADVEKSLAGQRARTDELQNNLDVATRRREIAEGQVARLTQLDTSLTKDISDLRQQYADTRKSLMEKEIVIAMLVEMGVNIASLVAGPPMPAIDARVTAVKSDVQPALVLLSVGSNDKVEKGFQFSVYRGSEFIGKVVVEKVLADSAGCRVIFTKDGATVQSGDSAATRLQ